MFRKVDPSKKRRIRNYLISPKEQLSHASFLVLTLTAGLGAICSFLLIRLQTLYDGMSSYPGAEVIVMDFRNAILYGFFIGVLVLGTIYGLASLVFTHRIFGALHVVEKYLKEILDGKSPPPLHSRQKDQVKRIVVLINELGSRIQKKQ